MTKSELKQLKQLKKFESKNRRAYLESLRIAGHDRQFIEKINCEMIVRFMFVYNDLAKTFSK